ncbi:autophagy-related protein 11-domain-containing protein [Russula compacta]|nr:autophagy-related protein 11-domain-containing protein [Russula compacta]
MIRICRAEDGEIFQTTATVEDIGSVGSLETFLHTQTGIEEDAIQAYLPDGRILRNENVQDLGGVQDQTIFVFNKYYIHKDVDEAMKLLHLQPTLQPPIEGILRPSELAASFRRVTSAHREAISRTLDSMRYQQSALRVASSSLDRHVLDVTHVFNDVAASARQELDRQACLIASVDTDIAMVSRVQIHRDFIPPAILRAMGAPHCAGAHVGEDTMKGSFLRVEETMKRLVDGATGVRQVLSDTILLDEAERLDQLSLKLDVRVSEAVYIANGPAAHAEALLQELKNTLTEQCLRVLSQINTLNEDLVSLLADLTDLQATISAKNTFSDIQRLHDLIYITVPQLLRYISEVMANFSAAEHEHRQAFRDEVHGKLPFDLIGMDNNVPSISCSLSVGSDTDGPYTLEPPDIDNLLRILEGLEQWAPSLKDGDIALVNIQELWNHHFSIILPASTREILDNDRRKDMLEEECRTLRAEIAHLREQFRNAGDEHERAERLERELNQAHAQIENEAAGRRALEGRYDKLLSIVERQREALGIALSEATGNTKTPDSLRRQEQVVQASENAKISALAAGKRDRAKGRTLLEIRGKSLRSSGEVRVLDEDSATRIDFRARASRAMGADQEKGRSLRVQASRHDGKLNLGDQFAEAGLGAESQAEWDLRDSELEDKLEEANGLIAQLLEISDRYRTTYLEALEISQDAVSHPSTLRLERLNEPRTLLPSPFVDPSDSAGAIEILRSFDHDHFLEAIKKTGSTIRKWQKQCKEYRERSKGKISFRNFSKGDLALFLPTRNTSSKPWAAFNVSNPHHFLKVTGSLVEQLKTREWMVGRITSITEHVVDLNVPDGNPYGLGDSVKYYTLEIEELTLRTQKHRGGTSPAPAETSDAPVE